MRLQQLQIKLVSSKVTVQNPSNQLRKETLTRETQAGKFLLKRQTLNDTHLICLTQTHNCSYR